MNAQMHSDVTVAIIGAGPYGLSLGAHLDASGVSHCVLGSPMESWIRHMPRGMYLKSEGHASNISDPRRAYTLARFCADTGRTYGDYGVPVPLDTFSAYGLWFAERAVPALRDVRVEAVARRDDGFVLELSDGATITSRAVVVATGVAHAAYVPERSAALSVDRWSHAYDHDDLGRFAGCRVAIVGAGQSALESAALIRESGGTPIVIARRAALAWNELPLSSERSAFARLREPIAGLGAGWKAWAYSERPVAFSFLPRATRLRHVRETFGPAGGWWLRERVEHKATALLGCDVVAASESADGVVLTLDQSGHRSQLAVDHLLYATGYRPSVARLSFLEPVREEIETADGTPRISRRFESSIPGLYFTGLAAAPTFGPVMRFVFGTKFSSNRIVPSLRRIAASSRTRAAVPATAAVQLTSAGGDAAH